MFRSSRPLPSGDEPGSDHESEFGWRDSGQGRDDLPIMSAARKAAAMRAGVMPRLPRPARRRVMVVANQKGGVGKTTTAVNMGAALAIHGLNVLLIDLDPQGNASTALGVDHHRDVPSVYDVLTGEMSIVEAAVPVLDVPNMACVPATIDLAGAEIDLVSMDHRETRLSRALAASELEGVDYVFIDCPPSLGLLTVNALTAAGEVLIPVQCEYYALEGLTQLLHTIELVRSRLNTKLDVSTILLTMYDGRTKLAEQVAQEVRRHFGPRVLRTTIPRSVRLSEAPSHGQTVLTYDPGSPGALSYLEAGRELARAAVVEEPATPAQ
jgi:chromosome partitioning protein